MSKIRINHPLEKQLNAPASDILDAISQGFRSVMNVKGQLAELYLYRKLLDLEKQAVIANLNWIDRDNEPDFSFEYKGRTITIECKNVRNEVYLRDRKGYWKKGWYKVETQKTRSGTDPSTGERTRPYRVDRFDILGVCLFNQSGQWEYLFCPSKDLLRHPSLPGCLATFQPVPPRPEGKWTEDLRAALDRVI